MPAITENSSSRLSSNTQWRLDIRERAVVETLVGLMAPHMVAKRAQAELALFVSKTDNFADRERAIDLIHGLNHGTVGQDEARRALTLLLERD
jgi:hypothetical protein